RQPHRGTAHAHPLAAGHAAARRRVPRRKGRRRMTLVSSRRVRQARAMRPIDRYAAALRHTLRASLALGAELTDAQWRAPTECPLWTVGDIYAHLVGGELGAAEGFPAPTGPFQEWVDGSVLKRRGRPRHEVLAELAALVDT